MWRDLLTAYDGQVITNPEDVEKLANDQYCFAYGIYLGLLQYFGFSLPQ